MSETTDDGRQRRRTVQEPPAHAHRHVNGHTLLVVEEYLPGPEPTPYDVTLGSQHEYRTRYWRCEHCGQERSRPTDFITACDAEPTTPLADGGYSIAEPRTKRALTEDMDVHFDEQGPVYRVDSASDNTYTVDIEAESCTCPDFQQRGEHLEQGCKHLRRVDLEIRAGQVPGLDGTFYR